MKIYTKILLTTLPLVVLASLSAARITSYFSFNALSILAENWLETRLADAVQIASEHHAFLRAFGLEGNPSSIKQAQLDAGWAMHTIDIGENGVVYAVDEQGIVATHPNQQLVGSDVSQTPWFQEMVARKNGKIDYIWQDESHLGMYQYFPPWNWYIISTAPQSEVYGPVNQEGAYVAALVVISAALLALILIILTRRLTQPLQLLAEGAEQIGRGKLKTRINIDSRDEFGYLANEFNNMAAQLQETLDGLKQEVVERKQAEAALQQAHDELETRVLERTKDLQHLNNQRFLEIEEHKQTKEALRQSETLFRHLVESLPQNIYSKDLEGRFTFVNQRYVTTAEKSNEEIVGKTDYDLHPPDFAKKYREDDQHVIDTGQPFETVEVHYPKDGEKSYVRVIKTPLYNAQGQIIGTLGIFWDISEQMRAEEALRMSEARLAESNQMLQLVLNTIPERVFWKDKDLNFLGCNRLFALDAGYQNSEHLLGKNDFDMVWRNEAELYRADDRAVIENKTPKLNYEEPHTALEGHTIWVRTSKTPLRNANDNIIGVLGIYDDITDFKLAQQEREKLIAELEAKNAELERFSYTVSHDLKSPLITIRGFVGMLEQDAIQGDRERMKQDIAFINAATDKMRLLLDDLLELSRIGRIVNPPEEVALTDIVQEAVDLVSGQISRRNVQVTILPNLPVVFGDRPRLLEVYQNLIENGVKYMGNQPQPHIEIGVIWQENETVCYVKDNGVGIDPRYHDKIFGLFDRLAQDVEGTGVGLALVKRIIKVHGGRIWIESEGEGCGSTFYFTLPEKNTHE